MPFEHKKIGEAPKQRELTLETKVQKPRYHPHLTFKKLFEKRKKWQLYFIAPILIFCLFLVIKTVFSVYDYGSRQNFVYRLLTPILNNVQKDENGFINILLIGQGGAGHDGAELADTIMVVSLDLKNNNVAMLSVPRDLWITYKYGASRINEVYRSNKNRLIGGYKMDPKLAAEESMNIFIGEVEKISKMKIPYYAKIDFKGFIEIVNEIGGITVHPKKIIHDNTYPDGKWGYEVFHMEPGIHQLDGATALKYARSRHNSSDFERAARQQEVIQAIKDKAISLGILTSPRKITNFLQVAEKNFETNLDIKELIALAIVGKDISKERMFSAVFNNDWDSKGGFLGSPPRAEYGGASVLIPYLGANKFEHIHVFTDLFFKHRDLNFGSFEVLNGTERSGLANTGADRLTRFGIPVKSTGNTPKGQNFKESELWIYKEGTSLESALPLLKEIFPIKIVNKIGYYQETDVTASFILGKDFK